MNKMFMTIIHDGMQDAPMDREILVGYDALGGVVAWRVMKGETAGNRDDTAFHWHFGSYWCELPGRSA